MFGYNRKNSKDDGETVKKIRQILSDDPIDYPKGLSEQEIVKKIISDTETLQKPPVRKRRFIAASAVACMAVVCTAVLVSLYAGNAQFGDYAKLMGTLSDMQINTRDSTNSLASFGLTPEIGTGSKDSLTMLGNYYILPGNTPGNIDTMVQDGHYLYTSSGNMLTIADISDAAQIKSATSLSYSSGQIMGLYLNGNTLAVILQAGVTQNFSEGQTKDSTDSYKPVVTVHFYDISNRSSLREIRSYTQDGMFNTAQHTDGTLYLVTSYSVDLKSGEKLTVQNAVPHAGYDGKTAPIPASQIITPPYASSPYYTVVTGLSFEAVSDAKTKAVLGGGGVYFSADNLYIFNVHSSGNGQIKSVTEVQRFSLKNSTISPTGNAQIDGVLISTQAVAESNGYLRVVSTQYTAHTMESSQITGEATQSSASSQGATGNSGTAYASDTPGSLPGSAASTAPVAPDSSVSSSGSSSSSVSSGDAQTNLYIFDSKMRIVGKLENMVPEQPIKSVCFVADCAYLTSYSEAVTVIDLSKPASPKLLGQTTFGGSPDLLLPYSGQYLIAASTERPGQSNTFELSVGKLTLRLIDVVDPTQPKVIDTYSFEANTSLSYESARSVLISQKDGLIGLPVATYITTQSKELFLQSYTESYCLLGIDPGAGFTLKGSVRHDDTSTTSSMMYTTRVDRAFLMGDTLFTLSQAKLQSNKLGSLSKLSELVLPQSKSVDSGSATSPTIAPSPAG